MHNPKSLTKTQLTALHNALYYMKMAQLKKVCLLLTLPHNGKKIALITRIITFVQSGEITKCATIPKQSKASNYPIQPLAPTALMLAGSYKNDAKTRAFFKELVGPHFHFTAFGIDWLNERWLNGEPSTYQEFANYWIAETKRRADIKAQPKTEWKYINFLQQMQQTQPELTKTELLKRWKKLQAEQASTALEILQLVHTKII